MYCYFDNNIDKESFPSTDLELMILQVVYPGASPLDVEQNAVIQIEDQLRTISGIDEFTSIITENAAIIFVQLDMEIDTSKAKDDIFRKMQSVPDMAEEVETIEDVYEPYLMQIGFIARTPRGRMAMPAAYEHMGYPYLG